MTHSIVKTGLALALVSLPLTACVEGGYNNRVGSAWASQSYDGWYDGYYGSIYDGYWGSDSYFYYRQNERDPYRRGDRAHFQRGEAAPNSGYHRFDGQTRQPPRGTRMPQYPAHRDDNRNYQKRNHSNRGHSNDGHDTPH